MLFAILILIQWLSVPSAPVATESDKAAQRAADGTSWFAATVTNEAEVASAKWTVAGRVTHAGIFDGEEYDARRSEPLFGEGLTETPEVNADTRAFFGKWMRDMRDSQDARGDTRGTNGSGISPFPRVRRPRSSSRVNARSGDTGPGGISCAGS